MTWPLAYLAVVDAGARSGTFWISPATSRSRAIHIAIVIISVMASAPEIVPTGGILTCNCTTVDLRRQPGLLFTGALATKTS